MKNQTPTPDLTQSLDVPHGRLDLPLFLPDATRGVVRAVDSRDLTGVGVSALQMNVFHLMQHPGSSTIDALGGLHRMIGWERPITTDSGGFQVYSLIRQSPKMGTITEQGAIFRPEGSDRKFKLTPEKSIRLQFSYGADILFCFDDCTHVDDPPDQQLASVNRTIKWARQAKAQFQYLVEASALDGDHRPRLFAVIQGGGQRDLRKRCAEELLEIGFDGFGYGGWPLDGQGELLRDIFAYVRELVPAHLPIHALGVGHPANIVESYSLGYGLFDSTMPTRDARHGRLYVFNADPTSAALTGDWFSYLYVQDKRHLKASGPVSPWCDCVCCQTTALGYVHHLFKIGDPLYPRLATIHNLRFIVQLMDRLRLGR
jgi:queuine tRNA-ribosyltransferase